MKRNDTDSDKEQSDLMKDVKASQALYADNVSHGKRFKSAFDTSQILGSDGKFLGIPMSEGASNTIRFLLDQVLPHMADYAGEKSTDLAQNIAKNVLKKTNPEEIAKFGKSWGKGIGYGVIFMQPIAETAATLYQTSNRLSDLRAAVVPVIKANGYNPTIEGIFSDGNNEVIANARQKIFSATMNDFVRTAARSVALIPSFYILKGKQQKRLEAAEQDIELEMLAKGGSAEDYQKYIKKHMGESSAFNAEHTKQLQKQIADGRKEYYANFETFKKENSRAIEREITKELESGMQDFYCDRYGLSSFGNTSNTRTQYFTDSSNQKYDPKKVLLKKIVDERVKEKYVEQSMPWDENWLTAEQKNTARRNSNYKPQTLKATIEEAHTKVLDKINEKVHGTKEKQNGKEPAGDGLFNQGIQAAASLAGELVEGLVTKGANAKLKEAIALDLITHLRRAIDENPQRETIPGHANSTEEYSYAMFVNKIFQQHQHDCGQSEIGDRYVANLKKDNWNDTDIQQRKDSELSAYEVAIKHISQYVRDGRMDPLALINLVGQRKIVASSGKSFGTLKTGDDEALKKSLVAEIDKQCALLKPHHHMSKDEISEAFAGYTFSEQELRAAFATNGLKDDARAFVFTLIDTHTPDEDVLKQITGLQDSEIKSLRQEAQARYTTLISAAVQEIAEAVQQSPDAIKKYRLSEAEAKSLIDVYQAAQQSGHSVVDSLNSSMRKEIENAVTNVMVEDGLHGQQQMWQQKIKPRAALLEQEEKQEVKSDSFAEKIVQKAKENKFAGGDVQPRKHPHEHFKSKDEHAPFQHTGHLQHARANQAPWGLAT